MFTNLKIIPNKALSETLLLNLGKINVICGKNNSGKSRLLESIYDDSKTVLGLSFSDIEFQKIFSGYKGVQIKKGYSGGTPRPESFKSSFEFALNTLIDEKKVYFADDVKPFTDKLSEIFERKHSKAGYDLITKSIEAEFHQIFHEAKPEIKKALLPPKRILEASEEIKFLNDVEVTGRWISNKLFFAKTQPTDSQEYKTYQKIKDTFTEISSGYRFDLFSDTENLDGNVINIIKLKFAHETQTQWIEAGDCGLGLRDLLVILYFSITTNNQVLLIEEPENHIHPEMQRKLLKFLSEVTDKQYFITTHSNIFLNTTYVNRIFFTTFENGVINVSDATKRTEMLNELGYSVSDNLVSDLIILVEGPKDTPIIEEFIKKFGFDADYNIKTWALGGDIMGQVDLSVFAERYKVIALIDKDPKSSSVRKKFTAKCKELDIPVTRLQRYAIENYFSVRALREIFKGQIPQKYTQIDPDKTLEEQIGINVKNNNRKLAKEMQLDEIKGTDFYNFFEKVKARLEE